MLSTKDGAPAPVVHTFVLSSPADITALHQAAPALLCRANSSSLPAFFLASVCHKVWAPRVVVVKRGNTIVGIVYAKERRVLGFPAGVIFGDATLGGMIVAEPQDREMVFRTAVNVLLQQRHVQSLRFVVPPHSPELSSLIALSAKSFEVVQTPVDYHSVLELPPGYAEFLECLGHRTRRNFRYYRERSTAAGHSYVETVPLPEFQKIAFSLLKERVVGADLNGIKRALSIFAAAERPLLVGLRAQDGEWLSILGGWYEANRAVVFLQMNSDRQNARFSLSLVTRSHLIESLIAKRVKELLFWAGVGPPLSRYVKPIPAVTAYVDKHNFAWRMLRQSINSHRKRLPAILSEWIAGPTDHQSALS